MPKAASAGLMINLDFQKQSLQQKPLMLLLL
jgi:hypothetical protein